MEEQQAIYWHQGMFMQPQHFQMADLHNQFRSKPLMDAGLPYFWGVGALHINTSSVVNRVIEIDSAQLLFEDRTYVEYPGGAVIAPRSFDTAWVEGDKPLMVYLGLKKLSSQEKNVTLVESLSAVSAVSTRYVSLSNPPEVADLFSDGPASQVRTLQHVVKIFFETELPNIEGFELIPIACLVRDGDTVKLDDDFIPPSYTLGASDVLMRTIREIRDELSGRTRQLQEYKSPREMQKAEFDASYMSFLLALRSLNRACPYLFHLTETRQVHPWVAYGTLRQLIGELSSFSERFNMLGESTDGSGTVGLPPYKHTDLHRCFERAHVLISTLLNEITVGPEFLAILEYREGAYLGDLPPSFFDRRNRFYLVIRTEKDPKWVVDSMQYETRLAAPEDIPGLIAHALPGIELIHIPSAPQGLPRRANSYYFRIEQVSQLWDSVERQGQIALQWLDAPDDLRAEVVVLRR